MKPTPTDIMRKAGRMFLASNPMASIKWIKKPQFITYPTGYKGYYARFIAFAPGYKTAEMIVDCNADGNDMMIR
jgi:hypothetical protein